MATYVFSYRSKQGYQPSGESFGQWKAWFDGLGDAVVAIGQPVGATGRIGTCDSDVTQVGGYSIIEAPDLETAMQLANGCPVLDRDGGVEIGELLTVPVPA
jgi:hypothetical protein